MSTAPYRSSLTPLPQGSPPTMKANEIEREARGAGISMDSVKRAKDRLGIVSKRDGRTGAWSWALQAATWQVAMSEQEADIAAA